MSLKSKFLWLVTRHPLLYVMRSVLFSRNSAFVHENEIETFADCNSVSDVHPLFFEVNSKMDISPTDSNFSKAGKIGIYLRANTKVGPGAGLSSGQTLQKMLYGSGGVCSDFSIVFNVFCLINQIPVREWHCADRLYKTRFGHAFNEIYDNQQQKWIAIDVHKGIYFTNHQKHLSVDELFSGLRAGKPLEYKFLSNYEPPHKDRLLSVYSAQTIPFLVSNYKIKILDPFLEKHSALPVPLLMIWSWLLRKNYRFVFYFDNYRQKLLESFST